MESILPAKGYSFDGTLDASPGSTASYLSKVPLGMQALRLEARDVLSDFYASLGSDASVRLILAGTSAQPPVTGGLGL
jgi:hypothetical protein